MKLSDVTGADVIPDFEHILSRISPEQQAQVTQYVARKAVMTGRFQLANWAAGIAFDSTRDGSKFHTRLKLYSAAGKIIDPERTEDTAGLIEGLNIKHLGTSDRKLFEAVKILSEQILRDPGIEDSFEIHAGGPQENMMETEPVEDQSGQGTGEKLEKVVALRSDRLKKLTADIASLTGGIVQ